MVDLNIQCANNEVIINCLLCGKQFVVHVFRKDTAKYCSKKCKDISQRNKISWNKGLKKGQYKAKEEVLANLCLNCGKLVKNKFCSQSCNKSYRNKQRKGKTFVELYGEKRALEIRKKMSEGISKTAAQTHFTRKGASVTRANRLGKTHIEIYGEEASAKIKTSIRASLHAFRQTPVGIEQRKKTSERNIKAILSGKTFARTEKGYYKDVYFGSSLEKSFLIQCYKLLRTLHNIKRNETEVLSLDDGIHKTVPDYLIVDNNNILIGIVECKWEEYMKLDWVYNKAKALYNHCRKQNIQAGYFTYCTLDYFKQLQGNPEPRQLKTLLNYMEKELCNYLVGCKVQRLSVEDKETNNTLKVSNSNSNCLYPFLKDSDIVRYPLKGGVCA